MGPNAPANAARWRHGLLWGLVALNVLLLGLGFGLGGRWFDPPAQIAQEEGLRAQALQVDRPWLAESNLLAVPKAGSSGMQSIDLKAGQAQLAQALAGADQKVQAQVAPTLQCQLWGPLLPDQQNRVKNALAKWPGQWAAEEIQTPLGFMVLIPKARVQQGQTVAELGKKGLKDLFVIGAAGPLQGSISAGIFRTQERAMAQLAFLESKGVEGAEVRERPGPSRYFIRLHGTEEHMRALNDLYRANPRGELAPCPAVASNKSEPSQ